MKMRLKRALHRLGFDLRRFRPSSSESARMAALLRHHEINLVLDVGANVGQFGMDLRNNLEYRGRIVSFEPMADEYAALCRTSSGDALWDVAPRAAIGATDGEIEINVSRNSMSSSILPMLETHVRSAPESQYERTEKVPLRRLDSIASEYLSEDSRIFLKVDTQGYEHQVLQGASEIIARVSGIGLELSLTPLYAGEYLLPQMVEHMKTMRFDLWGLSPAFVDQNTGRMLQIDAMFFRQEN